MNKHRMKKQKYFFGTVIDNEMDTKVRTMLIASGFE